MKTGHILLIIFCVAGIFLIGFLIGVLKKNEPPNDLLYQYLQEQRRISDSTAAANFAQFQSILTQAREAHTRDSLQYANDQARLLTSIQSIKKRYDQIPAYTDLSKDSLRSSISAAFPR